MKFFKKSLGQNLLVDLNIIKKITQLVKIQNKLDLKKISVAEEHIARKIVSKSLGRFNLSISNNKKMLNKNILNHAILSCKNHRDLDKKTIKKFIPGYKLMENAGGEIFKIIKIPEWINLVTGWDTTHSELEEVGERIANLRMAFAVKHGNNPAAREIPGRLLGTPPQEGIPRLSK